MATPSTTSADKRLRSESESSPLLSILKKSRLDFDSTTLPEMSNVEQALSTMDQNAPLTPASFVALLIAMRVDTDLKVQQVLDEKNRQIETLNNKVEGLENKIDELEQYSRRNSVRIHGLPEDPQRTTEDISMSLLRNKLVVNIEPWQVTACHRIGAPHPNKPRPIILKLSSYDKKKQIIKSRRKLKGTKIVVFEDMTKTRSNILKHARRLKSDKLIKDCWSINGTTIIKDIHDQTTSFDTLIDLMSQYPEVLSHT
jgi:hypothetical protein